MQAVLFNGYNMQLNGTPRLMSRNITCIPNEGRLMAVEVHSKGAVTPPLCGGGFDPEMLGFAFPSPAGAAGSRPLRERGNAPRARTHRVGGTPFLPAHQVGGTPLVPAGAARAARSKGEGGDTQLGGTGGDRGTVPAPGPAGAKSSGSQLANRSWQGSSRGGGSPATASQAARLQTHVKLQRARRL